MIPNYFTPIVFFIFFLFIFSCSNNPDLKEANQNDFVFNKKINIQDTPNLFFEIKKIDNKEFVIVSLKKQDVPIYGFYEFKGNEILMLIAFNIYGDYLKWHDLYKWNEELILSGLQTGDKLKYFIKDKKTFQWPPKGTPYLIRPNDTLIKISNKLYNTPYLWKALWYNNALLIKSPDLIFSGFTLYYLELEEAIKIGQ